MATASIEKTEKSRMWSPRHNMNSSIMEMKVSAWASCMVRGSRQQSAADGAATWNGMGRGGSVGGCYFKRAGGLGGKAIGGGMNGTELWQRRMRTRWRSPTRVRFKVVEYNADMRGPLDSGTKWRQDGALLGHGEKDGTDSWLLGQPKGRKGINKNFVFYFLKHIFKPNFNLNSNSIKFDQTQAS